MCQYAILICRMNKVLQKLGNNIRAERNRLNMSQAELAEKVGLSIPHISKIESGLSDIKFTNLIAILKALNIPFEKLYEL